MANNIDDIETKDEEKKDNKDNNDDYETYCYLCRRPESTAGPFITLPGNMHICNDCMQKSFDAFNSNQMQFIDLSHRKRKRKHLLLLKIYRHLIKSRLCLMNM